MASIPVVLLNGTTADANEVMADFNEIYSNIDQTNIGAPNKTGTGRIVLDTNPTISGLTLSNPTITGNITGTPTWLGRPTFSVGLTVPTTQTITLNAGGTTGITENSANLATFFVNGSPSMRFRDSGVSIEPTTRFSLDGGGNDYLTSPSNDNIQIVTNGVESGTFSSLGLSMNGGRGLFVQSGENIGFDGVAGNTFINEVSTDILRSVVGGNDALRMQRVDSTRISFGFNGNGVNPNTLSPNSDIVIGNPTDTVSRSLIIQSHSTFSGTIGFSDTAGTSQCSLFYNHFNDLFQIIPISGNNVTINGNAEFRLPDLSAPSDIAYASRRSFAKAWANVSGIGTGGSVSWGFQLNFNGASITGNSTSFTITWATAFSNADYAVSITQGETNWGIVSDVMIQSKTASQIVISRYSGGAIAGTGLGNVVNYHVIAYGT